MSIENELIEAMGDSDAWMVLNACCDTPGCCAPLKTVCAPMSMRLTRSTCEHCKYDSVVPFRLLMVSGFPTGEDAVKVIKSQECLALEALYKTESSEM